MKPKSTFTPYTLHDSVFSFAYQTKTTWVLPLVMVLTWKSPIIESASALPIINSSPIVRIFGKGKCKFIANFSAAMATSLPSPSLPSLSLSLSLSPKVPHAQYGKRGSASYYFAIQLKVFALFLGPYICHRVFMRKSGAKVSANGDTACAAATGCFTLCASGSLGKLF